MDCNQNIAPSYTRENTNSTFKNPHGQWGYTKIRDPTEGMEYGMVADRGHEGIKYNKAEAFSCIRFKDTPVKCINFMSHYI